MDSLLSRALARPERSDAVRLALAAAMAREHDALVEQNLAATLKIAGYAHIETAAIRPNTARAMHAVREALHEAAYDRFGDLLTAIALQRAREGLPPSALFAIVELTEDTVGQLAVRHFPELADLACIAVLLRRICDRGRAVIVGAFEATHLEARAEVDRLARQFSAPILPALPGVLVLPIVGAVSQTRAAELVDALLRGVAQHAAHTVIVDITGLVDIDDRLFTHLHRASSATRLLGAQLVLVGVSPTVAIKLAGASQSPDVRVHATLAAALHAASRGRA